MARSKKKPKSKKSIPKDKEPPPTATWCTEDDPPPDFENPGLKRPDLSREFMKDSISKYFDQVQSVRDRRREMAGISTMGTDVAEDEKGPYYTEVIHLLQPFMDGEP